jgi:hypothetical protein
MKLSEIKVGVTYVNRGAGRTVLAIGSEHRPPSWLFATSDQPDDTGVLFEYKGKQYTMYLATFAKWAKRPLECDHPWHRNSGLIMDCPECGASG